MCASRILLVAALFSVSACNVGGRSEHPDTVLVSAAVSLSDALTTVAGEYERASGIPVVLNLAGSDTLATQLTAGAPADVFVSADDRQMDRVQEAGALLTDTRIDLLANQLVVVVPAGRPQALTRTDDLRLPQIRRLAMGDPDSVPAGVYARQYLESKGIWEDVRTKIVPTRDVRAALAVVAAGNADAGIVYRTDVARQAGVSVAFEVPIDAGPPIRYPAAAIAGRKQEAARRFLSFLSGPTATEAFKAAGFIPLLEGSDTP